MPFNRRLMAMAHTLGVMTLGALVAKTVSRELALTSSAVMEMEMLETALLKEVPDLVETVLRAEVVRTVRKELMAKVVKVTGNPLRMEMERTMKRERRKKRKNSPRK